MLTALRKEPGRRYASVHELASDLERYLAGHPVLARPATWHYRGGNPGMNAILRACDNLVVSNVFAREVHGYRFLLGGFCKGLREHLPPERVLQGIVDDLRHSGASA